MGGNERGESVPVVCVCRLCVGCASGSVWVCDDHRWMVMMLGSGLAWVSFISTNTAKEE